MWKSTQLIANNIPASKLKIIPSIEFRVLIPHVQEIRQNNSSLRSFLGIVKPSTFNQLTVDFNSLAYVMLKIEIKNIFILSTTNPTVTLNPSETPVNMLVQP